MDFNSASYYNMGSTWGRQDLGGPHVGHMKLAIWAIMAQKAEILQ